MACDADVASGQIGDWHRFTGRTIGSFVGLVPTEYSSGATRAQGAITKTGNSHARRLLVEATWLHRPAYRPSVAMHHAGPWRRRRHGCAAMRATAESATGGWCSSNGRSATRRPPPRSRVSWPAGAGDRAAHAPTRGTIRQPCPGTRSNFAYHERAPRRAEMLTSLWHYSTAVRDELSELGVMAGNLIRSSTPPATSSLSCFSQEVTFSSTGPRLIGVRTFVPYC